MLRGEGAEGGGEGGGVALPRRDPPPTAPFGELVMAVAAGAGPPALVAASRSKRLSLIVCWGVLFVLLMLCLLVEGSGGLVDLGLGVSDGRKRVRADE